MENSFNPTPDKSPESKKIYKAGIIDISKIAESQVKDVADSRMTEDKEDRSKNWFIRTAKRVWKHNLAQEWYRQREVRRVKEEIQKSGNLYAGESKDVSMDDFNDAKKAIIERFVSEYEDDMLKKEEKDSKKNITDESIKNDLKDLIKKFAGDPSFSEESFKEEQKRIISKADPEYQKKGKMYADNFLDIAKEIRNSIAHGEKLNELDFDLDITLGKAKESLNTEAQHNTFEKIVEKTQNSKLGKYLFNEATAVGLVAGLYSAGKFFGMKALRSNLVKWGTFGAGAVLAGGVSASREAARLNRERSQHIREKAKGMQFKEDDMKRRKEMEENRYETKEANDLIKILENDLDKISKGDVNEADLDLILGNLSEIEARIKIGDERKIDLISYSRFSEVEKERMNLDLNRAKLKVAIRKGINEGKIDFKKSDSFDKYLEKLITTQSSENVSKDIEQKDKIFKSMKRKRVAGAFVKTALIGGTVGFVFQEVQAVFTDRDGIFEGIFNKDGNLSTKATALEGLRRWITGDEPRLPFGHGHEMILGNTHLQLPDNITIQQNADGTFDVLRDKDVISDNIKLTFKPDGDLTDASKDLLAKDNIFTNFFQTGGTVTKVITKSAEEYINEHPELTTGIDREWMGNDTPMYPDPNNPGHLLGADLNELRTNFGGVGGTGIDKYGNYELSVAHMTNDGSFQDGVSVAAKDEMSKGNLFMLLSATKGTQHEVFKLPIGPDGKVSVDPNSTIGKMFFENRGGKAVFIGQFLEIGSSNGLNTDGDEKMRILGTLIGEGKANSITEEIIKDTTTPNVKFDASSDWNSEIPPIIPIPYRRPLERGEYNEKKRKEIPYPYYYGGEMDRKKWRDDFSPRLKNNPDAKLNPKEEIDWYFEDQKRRYPGYVEKELKNLEDQNPKKLGKGVEAIACVAVAGHQEHNNIYKTLETYAVQKDKNGNSVWKKNEDGNKFEIFLFVNWPKGKDPQKTLEEIERFKKDYPNVKIRVYKEEITGDKVELGWIKKKIFDLALRKHQERNNGKDVKIITNDADMTFISPTYLEDANDTLDDPKNEKVDGVLGRFDLDPEVYVKNPTFHTIMKFWQFMEAVMRSKYEMIGSQGRNTIMRGSSYAAVGGNRTKEFWADIEFAQLFDEARGGKPSMYYSNKTWVNVDPRREIDKFKSGERVAYTWGGDFDTRAVRGIVKSENDVPENLNMSDLSDLAENDPKVIEFKKRLEEELTEIVNLFSKITPGYISAPADSGINKENNADIKMLAERAAGFLGMKINISEVGVDENGKAKVKVRVLDSKKLRESLKKYKEENKNEIKLNDNNERLKLKIKKLREDLKEAEKEAKNSRNGDKKVLEIEKQIKDLEKKIIK